MEVPSLQAAEREVQQGIIIERQGEIIMAIDVKNIGMFGVSFSRGME